MSMIHLLAGNAPSGMVTPVQCMSGAPASVDTANTEYNQFCGATATDWSSVSTAGTPISIRGTISTLYVIIETAPGVGKSWTYTLYKNTVSTGLTVTIADNNLTGSDLSHTVSVEPGDVLAWAAIPSGTPAAPTNIVMSCVFRGANYGESFFSGGFNTDMPTAATGYKSPFGGAWTGTNEAIAAALMPTAGVLDKLYVNLNTSPGAGNSYAFTIYKNGIATSLGVTISDSATTGSDLADSVSFAAGDTISIEVVPTSGPVTARAHFGMRMTPTVPGESIVSFAGLTPNNTATRYVNPFAHSTSGSATASTLIQMNMPVAATLRKLYTAMDVAAGAGKSRTSSSYINAGAGTLSAAMSGDTATTANDTVNSDALVLNDKLFFRTVPAGTPTATAWYKISAVFYIAP